jgi:SAM-dependent methyltransferase
MGYPNWRWDYDIAMTEAIQKFPGGRVLDIGAGVGKFLRGLADNWERYAVEGSESTRRELEAASVKVFRELSEAVQSNAGTFQVITLFQVLEHIADFDLILKQCHRLLVPGGRLVVTVPDGDAMIRQERMTGSPDMPPNHINKWTPGSLSRVLERTGFRLGQPMYEPPSWKSLRNNLHLRVSADAMVKNSLSSKAYGIRAKGLRIAILSFLGAPALIRMIRYGDQVWAGGAFGLIGTA